MTRNELNSFKAFVAKFTADNTKSKKIAREALYAMAKQSGLPDYDTARGMFTEGAFVYGGAGFREKSHVQSP